jgi:ribonucleoside-diphosphate reductase alpha chain
MERLERNQDWSLFCPDEAPGLADVYGQDFNELYQRYESEGRARKVVPIQKIWMSILKSQVETGTPYMLYKDACNRKSNQKNLGTIKSSNLCTEIIEHTDADNTAVCNLASLGLPTFVRDGEFDFEKLEEITRLAVRNLNNVIDINWYPTDPAKNSNFKNRPVALGVQGLADVYAILGLEFGYGDLNRNIFETIYYAAVSESMELAKKFGPYQTFQGSPASKGKLQFDLWNVCPTLRYDWGGLKRDVVEHGMRNSLLVGPMPTATTSQILGFNECFEPFTSNFYLRRTLAGEFVVVNKYLMNELISLGVWTKELKNTIIKNNGSIQDIPDIPDHVKQVYRTVWEISPRLTIDMAAERGPYICQSQSMNLFVDAPTNGKLSSIHMYAWKHGLKTGMYYLRTKAKAKAIQFTLDPSKYGKKTNAEECTMCSA